MDNNNLQGLIDGIGALTELWTLTYENFIEQGFDVGEAIVHTREFIKVVLGTASNQG